MRKFHVTPSANTPPVADVVPAGISTVYSVALGKRSISSALYSKVSVLVPIHFQVPVKAGVICTGTSAALSSSSVVNGTIGWLKVTLRKGAIGISPSGAKRSTSNGPAATSTGALTVSVGGGKVLLIVTPGRGGGNTSWGRRKSTWSLASTVSSSTRPSSVVTAASSSGVVGATAGRSGAAGCSLPSLRVICSPRLGAAVGVSSTMTWAWARLVAVNMGAPLLWLTPNDGANNPVTNKIASRRRQRRRCVGCCCCIGRTPELA